MAEDKNKDGKLDKGKYADSNRTASVESMDINNKFIDNRKPVKTTTVRLKKLR